MIPKCCNDPLPRGPTYARNFSGFLASEAAVQRSQQKHPPPNLHAGVRMLLLLDGLVQPKRRKFAERSDVMRIDLNLEIDREAHYCSLPDPSPSVGVVGRDGVL